MLKKTMLKINVLSLYCICNKMKKINFIFFFMPNGYVDFEKGKKIVQKFYYILFCCQKKMSGKMVEILLASSSTTIQLFTLKNS